MIRVWLSILVNWARLTPLNPQKCCLSAHNMTQKLRSFLADQEIFSVLIGSLTGWEVGDGGCEINMYCRNDALHMFFGLFYFSSTYTLKKERPYPQITLLCILPASSEATKRTILCHFLTAARATIPIQWPRVYLPWPDGYWKWIPSWTWNIC